MKLLIAPIFLFVFVSCASFNNPRQIQEVKRDGLRFESLTRYDEKRLVTKKNRQDPLSLCHQGQFTKANNIFKKNLDQKLKSYTYWNQISSCYILQKKYTQAKAFLDIAMSTTVNKKQKSIIYNNYGVILLEKSHFEEAKIYFKKSISLYPDFLTPHFNLSQIYLKFDLFENARKKIDMLLSKNASDIDFLHAKAYLQLMQKRYKSALVFFNKIPKKYRSRDDIATSMAMTYFMLGLYSHAKESIANAQRVDSFYLMNQLNISKKISKRLKNK